MNKTLTYLTAFSISILSCIFTLEYLKNKPIETDIITLSNGNKEVVLYGMTHYAKKEYYDNMLFTLEDFKKQNYDILTEGIGTDNSVKNILINLFLSERINNCINFDKKELSKLTNQYEYLKNTEYSKYWDNDLFLEDLVLQVSKTPEKSYICFDEVGIEGLRLYTRFKRIYKKENEKNAYLYNRDINITNHILLSHKQKVAVFYGNEHLNFTIELLEKVGYKIIKEESIKAY